MRLDTPRLILRPWENRDRAGFAAINADPEVRRYYYPSVLTPAETDALIDEAAAGLAEIGFVAVERRADGALVGGAGLSRPGPPGAGRPSGRDRLDPRPRLLAPGPCHRDRPGLPGRRLVPLRPAGGDRLTSAINTPSRRAMERLGLGHIAGADFEDVTVPPGDPLRPHVLYRIARPG